MATTELICEYSGLPSLKSYEEKVINESFSYTDDEINRIIEMAWEDRTPFEAIEFQFGLKESEIKELMKKNLKFSSYKRWRIRVENCNTKHAKKRVDGVNRFKSNLQRSITFNKISKR
ncbi:MAG: TIGR03643 family protein [Opitutaceae bacterium]|nr:TIGR03643 family protein [Cytophagales bacterium]